jgi:hypothetical protein
LAISSLARKTIIKIPGHSRYSCANAFYDLFGILFINTETYGEDATVIKLIVFQSSAYEIENYLV